MDEESLMLIEPGELHITRQVPLSDFHVLLVDAALVHDLLGERRSAHSVHFREGQHRDRQLVEHFQSLCADIQRLTVSEEAPEPLAVEERLIGYLAAAVHTAGERGIARRAICQNGVRLARDYIHDNFSRKLSLSELACLAELSPYHFSRSFRAEVGLPPGRYLRQVRVGWALDLLRTGLPISLVSQVVGFCSQAELTRSFVKELGFAPGLYQHPRRRPRESRGSFV